MGGAGGSSRSCIVGFNAAFIPAAKQNVEKSRELLNNIPEEWGGVWELGGKENGCDLFVCFWRYR